MIPIRYNIQYLLILIPCLYGLVIPYWLLPIGYSLLVIPYRLFPIHRALLAIIITKVGRWCHRPPQAATGWISLARMASNPREIDKNSWESRQTPSICTRMLRMHPYGAICSHLYQKHMIEFVSCCKNMGNTEITQMTFLPMSYMQNFDANPMAPSNSSQIPYMIKTYMQKKWSVASAEPINIRSTTVSIE